MTKWRGESQSLLVQDIVAHLCHLRKGLDKALPLEGGVNMKDKPGFCSVSAIQLVTNLCLTSLIFSREKGAYFTVFVT